MQNFMGTSKLALVDVWTVALDLARPLWLTEEEKSRAARFRFERDRLRWGNARSALRAVLGGQLGVAPLDIQFTFGEHGKPAVVGVEFNISHSREWAMIAVAGAIPVGVDIEAIREDVDIAKLLARIGETGLERTTKELFHAWTRREAKTKSLGTPLMEIPGGDVRAVDIEAPAGFAASVALVGWEPVVRRRLD
jgi:4'-phosphopantetheinyl transferase